MKDPLDEMLEKLPRDIAVPRNLWPEIERKIKRTPRSFAAVAFAASIAVCMLGAVTWAVLHSKAKGVMEPRDAISQLRSFDEPSDPGYLAARGELEKSFTERLATLEPNTRAKVEANLAIIRRAHEEIRRALDDQPANPVLQHLLDSTLHAEFDLYDNVVRGTQPSMLRI